MPVVISAREAAALVRSHSTLAVSGFGAYAAPENLLKALRNRFDQTGDPGDLTVTCGICPGNQTRDEAGLNILAKDGLIGTIIAAHYGNPALIGDMIANEKIAGYGIPLGVMIHLYGAIAGHKTAVLTHVGLETFADPRLEGCQLNDLAKAQNRKIVELVQIGGELQLAYYPFPIDACFIRASAADEEGNLSAEYEAVGDLTFDIAAATHNSGGIVIAEVPRVVPSGSLNPRNVMVHGSLVDYLVKVDAPQFRQGYAHRYRPELCGQERVAVSSLQPMPMSNRKVIARRAAMELLQDHGGIINLGTGIPSGLGSVANEEGIPVTLSMESGALGGVPMEGLAFGASVNADAIHTLANTFHLYDGGMLRACFLGIGEADAQGNVNVSRFGKKCTGPGGFINISQNTEKAVFMGTFTVGGLREEIRDGKLHILKEGTNKKFVNKVQQITFSGNNAMKSGHKVMFITERAVFQLSHDGLVLTEIAPGMDVERDIMKQMEFLPILSPNLKYMDTRIFQSQKMNVAIEASHNGEKP